jgi:hypothetical protein
MYELLPIIRRIRRPLLPVAAAPASEPELPQGKRSLSPAVSPGVAPLPPAPSEPVAHTPVPLRTKFHAKIPQTH